MRKLIVIAIMSLDGYVAGPGEDVMVLPMDHAFDEYNLERMRTAGTTLLGRRSYEGFKGFWPMVDGNDAFGPVQQEFSRLDDAVAKVVVSDTLTMDQTAPWTDTTTIVRRAEAHAVVAGLKRGDETEGDIVMWGSHTLWADLLAAGLVDELHLMVGPVVLGDGIAAFEGGKAPALKLVGTRTWEGSDNVLLRYSVERS
ncbi:dihydrofolate reductase family protein [Catenulispora subtropica]|uniref:Dihydrofolate reductase family protein n=1 Tax=Catenulispora subtropica TaxID=450798 RepID=A0ABP5CLT8_9ACTN